MRHRRRPRRWDHAWVPALVATVVALAATGARLVWMGGDPSRFVVAGDRFVDRAAAPRALSVLPDSAGYDGQFFFRLALDPFTAERTAFGIELDNPMRRQQRILYPLLAWLLSGGDAARAAWALIAVNVIGLGMLAWVGGLWARQSGRHALYGLVFPAYPGFALTLARDLSEILAGGLALGGLYLLRRERAAAAATALTLAVLARESVMIIIAGLAGVWLWARLSPAQSRAAAAGLLPAFAVPLVVAVAWQIVLQARWATLATTAAADAFGIPFAGLASFVVHGAWRDSPFRELQLLDLAFLAACVATAAWSLPSSAARAYEKAAWVVALAAAVSFSSAVWVEDWAFMRALTELYLLGIIVLLGRRDELVLGVGTAAGVLWIASAAMHATSP